MVAAVAVAVVAVAVAVAVAVGGMLLETVVPLAAELHGTMQAKAVPGTVEAVEAAVSGL